MHRSHGGRQLSEVAQNMPKVVAGCREDSSASSYERRGLSRWGRVLWLGTSALRFTRPFDGCCHRGLSFCGNQVAARRYAAAQSL
ncbi:hypothetical protein RB213_015149, partial [Colletotrichum asianum]